ncbi:MAG: flagellar biosynthetic protein FliR [Actinomyces sp.]|jgi:flagellar biosynthetic protein FliR|nr:flagellar biosynthetic protein FliR [Actinomyces sp.]MCI1641396.1 flagellar biosynthetic protein FliR [Actinomyces sp.]MCI1662314.1 flagellar biosynthetic protein FliR [Actinomyces sp.]MCI1691776.1 flagellar biosynthetic protein FliR [Actinomyces sp.]MCI1787460.1 flagellar biosynthetic protein FliR [Actinomyces sp.]MCI1830907.1 flagellar biosynthetic protein FliR [Actinomyces sp.]
MDVVAALTPFALVCARTTAFVFTAPPFAHGGIPMTVKTMLAVLLAVCLAPGQTAPDGAFELVTGVVTEVGIGAGMGLLASTVLSAVQSAGHIIDLEGGFQLGEAFDPLTSASSGPYARFYQMLATVLLFASNGYQMLLLGFARSFAAVPPGTALEVRGLSDALSREVPQLLLAAIQIAGPLVAVLFLADLGLGLLTRVAPSLNAFAMGFPLKILLTLVLGVVALVALPSVVSALASRAVDLILGQP